MVRNNARVSTVNFGSTASPGASMKTVIIAALCGLLGILSAAAFATEIPFDQAKFDAARESGAPVAIVFHADWCPTCRAQAPILRELAQSPPLAAVRVFVADFDAEKAAKKSLGVTKQSTIVVFKKGKEIARSTGDTQRDSLATLLRNAIS
jgi:thioredoxin 1